MEQWPFKQQQLQFFFLLVLLFFFLFLFSKSYFGHVCSVFASFTWWFSWCSCYWFVHILGFARTRGAWLQAEGDGGWPPWQGRLWTEKTSHWRPELSQPEAEVWGKGHFKGVGMGTALSRGLRPERHTCSKGVFYWICLSLIFLYCRVMLKSIFYSYDISYYHTYVFIKNCFHYIGWVVLPCCV